IEVTPMRRSKFCMGTAGNNYFSEVKRWTPSPNRQISVARSVRAVAFCSLGCPVDEETVQFVQGLFVSSYDATIEDSYRKHFTVDGEECRLEILDTAGTEQFSGMRDLYVRNGHGFILVYSINDRSSLNELKEIRDTIVRLKQHANIPMVVVGNKTDLPRMIPTSAGRDLSKLFGCSFYEASAKLNENVSEIFTDCVRQISKVGSYSHTKKTLRLCKKTSPRDVSRFNYE
ncbi:Ras family protein, partial [Necator americanus]